MFWFDVDKEGLARLVDARGKAFVLHELVQNAWDTNAKHVSIKLTKVPGAPKATIEILDDDPDGFKSLDHAWTLFAPSEKKTEFEKRGRFNLGEKLVLAVCYEAEIASTTGAVVFDTKGRHVKRVKRVSGSLFRGVIRMTAAEYDEVCAAAKLLIPPAGVETVFNGAPLVKRYPIRSIEIKLPTLHADAEGFLRRTERLTKVNVYGAVHGQATTDETPMLYEMGIPICELGGGERWHVEIMQKVPLNMDRDGVSDAYLRTIRVAVLNAMSDVITADDAAATWAREAAADERVEKRSFEQVIQHRFGDKVATYDPSDLEANMNVVAKGYSVVKGAQLSGGEWENMRRFEVSQPAGRIAPTRKVLFGPGGKDTWIPRDRWTVGMRAHVAYSEEIGRLLLDEPVHASILSDITENWRACYGDNGLVFNVGRLGHTWFERVAGIDEGVDQLLIHEFAHHRVSNHLADDYHEECCRLGAKLKWLALDKPELFINRTVKP